LAVGADPTWALIISQVVLSFGVPFALIPLILLTRNRSILGVDVNTRLTTALAVIGTVFVVVVNAALLWVTFTS